MAEKISQADRDRRRERLIALRAGGMHWHLIVEAEVREGFPRRSLSAVRMEYERAMGTRKKEAAAHAEYDPTLEDERLDLLQRANEQVLRGAQTGRCVTCGRAPDPELVMKATNVLLRVAERRARLKGLDLGKKGAAAPAAEADPVDVIKKRIGLSIVR